MKSQAFAHNRQELTKLLQGQGLIIIYVKESAGIAAKHVGKQHKRVKAQDLTIFAKEFAILLENGVAIMDVLDVIGKQLESTDLITAVKGIKKELEGGSTLSNAMGKYPRIFSLFWQDMTEAGELSGQLPYVMKQISVFVESREDIKKKTLNAFLYPAILMGLALFTVVVFVFKVIPVFKGLFSSFGSKLPPLTQAIFNMSEIVKKYFFVAVAIIAIAIFMIRKAFATKPGRRLYERVAFNAPVVGGLLLALSIERFASTLAVLLKSGIPIIKAMEVAVKASQSLVFSERIEDAKIKVMGGLPFSEALQHTSLFPPLTIQLLSVAEKTGNYSGMLEEVSKYYKDIIENALTRFTTLIGPVVLILMTVMIGGIVIAMFLPIFKIATL